MEYNQFIDSVRKLNVIRNEEQADAAVKATMGIIASRMREEDARDFANDLPEPLSREKLRDHQVYENEVSPQEHIEIVASQFNLPKEDARELVKTVLGTARENLSEEKLRNWKESLPNEWSSFIERV